MRRGLEMIAMALVARALALAVLEADRAALPGQVLRISGPRGFAVLALPHSVHSADRDAAHAATHLSRITVMRSGVNACERDPSVQDDLCDRECLAPSGEHLA